MLWLDKMADLFLDKMADEFFGNNMADVFVG